MTRDYALLKLLEHGPLTFDECVKYTGWPPEDVREALAVLRRRVAYICDNGRRVYRSGRVDRNKVRRDATAKIRLLDAI